MLKSIVEKVQIYPIKDYENIEGFLSRKEAIALYRYAQLLPKNSSVVEIGSWKGKSTYCIAKGLKNGLVYAIDPFNAMGDTDSEETYNKNKGSIELKKQFINNMTTNGVIEKIRIKQGISADFVDDFEGINFLFIDGDHSIDATKFDFENYEGKIFKGGYIAFHDYYPHRKELGPTWVIENLIIPSTRYKHEGTYGSLWVGKKI